MTIILMMSGLFALIFLLSISAYKIGFHRGAYSVLEKMKDMNDAIEKGVMTRDLWYRFLAEVNVQRNMPPDFVDELRGKLK